MTFSSSLWGPVVSRSPGPGASPGETRPAVSGHTSTTACGQGHSCEWRPSSVAVTRHHAPFWRQGARYIANAGCRGHTHTAAHAVPVPGTRHIQQIRGPAFPLAPPACVAPGKAGNGQLGDAGREVLPVFAMRRLRQTGRRLASCASRLSPRAGRRSCWRGWELGAGSWSCQNESVQGLLAFPFRLPLGRSAWVVTLAVAQLVIPGGMRCAVPFYSQQRKVLVC